MSSEPALFRRFKSSVAGIKLPEKFTFPFYYEPHPLSILAADELKAFLEHEQEFDHNFGLEQDREGMIIGKMFGVLVVQNTEGELGYLAAFSGKLANENHHAGFVPPVYDMLSASGFFKPEEEILNQLNAEIESLENSTDFNLASSNLEQLKLGSEQELSAFRQRIKTGKESRKQQREKAKSELSETEYVDFEKEMVRQSLDDQYQYKRLAKDWRQKLEEAEQLVSAFKSELTAKKTERRNRSNALQKRLFDEYTFLNANGERASLLSIFEKTEQQTPPAGAGECAAPKLLHYAYANDLKPICLGEFWWGASPKSEVRRHGQFYPACRGKCEPILGHMLQGLNVDSNPMLENPAEGKSLKIFYEDEAMLAVNKPAEFLSVPGKNIKDSVASRVRALFPNAEEPMIVHRLDMSTSGIMLVAKTKEAHDRLQKQFLKKTIQKRYLALLDGELTQQSGEIILPLRVDLDNRPQQMVCFEHGKPAHTKWELVEIKNGKSLIRFFPITGRTHQLRVHAAHHLGLNMPIIGDDLYGKKADRLYLHAEQITFRHPSINEWMTLSAKAEF